MKIYQKPELEAVVLRGTAALCASQFDPSSQIPEWMYDDSYDEME